MVCAQNHGHYTILTAVTQKYGNRLQSTHKRYLPDPIAKAYANSPPRMVWRVVNRV